MPDRTYVAPAALRRPLVFLGERVKSPPFSDEARRKAGELLALVQEGEDVGMPRSRPLPVIGPRCHELRIEDGDVTWRIVYRVDPTVVLIPVLFAKKTRTLPRRTIDLCQRGWRSTMSSRNGSVEMDPETRARLESEGHHVVTDVADWLGLSQAEGDFIDIRLDLRRLVRFARERAGLTQAQAARKLKSSQSRVSKMESGDPSVSLDLLVSSALTLGATRQEVATAVAGPVTAGIVMPTAPTRPASAGVRRSRQPKAA